MASPEKSTSKPKSKTKSSTRHKPQSLKNGHKKHQKRELESRKESKKKSKSREKRHREKPKQESEQQPEEKELDWDPECSYVGACVPMGFFAEVQEGPSIEELEPQRKLWKTDTPIHDRNKIPSEWKWHDREPDLAKDDIDGHIKRYKQRIADGILPLQFEVYLEEWEKKKRYREMIKARFPGKSFEVAQRLDSLYDMKASLLKDGDDYKQVPNIDGLIQAYESGALDWHDGLVTYWSYGKQLCQPRPLDFDEFLRVNKKHEGHESFWTEGALPLEPIPQFLNLIHFHGDNNPQRPLIKSHYSLKLCGSAPQSSMSFEFIEDTGSSLMQITKSDIVRLYASHLYNGGQGSSMPPLVGTVSLQMADDSRTTRCIVLLDVNLASSFEPIKEYVLPNWITIQCVVIPDDKYNQVSPIRLSGPWLRKMLFTATVPDGTDDLLVYDKIEGANHIHLCCGRVRPEAGHRPPPNFLRLNPIAHQDRFNY